MNKNCSFGTIYELLALYEVLSYIRAVIVFEALQLHMSAYLRMGKILIGEAPA